MRNEWYSIFHAIRNLAEWNSLPYTGVIDRPDLQEILVRNMKEGTILNGMGINSYKQHEGKRDDDGVELVVMLSMVVEMRKTMIG